MAILNSRFLRSRGEAGRGGAGRGSCENFFPLLQMPETRLLVWRKIVEIRHRKINKQGPSVKNLPLKPKCNGQFFEQSAFVLKLFSSSQKQFYSESLFLPISMAK